MPTMGRFALVSASFALLGSVQAFATTGAPAVDPNTPAGFSDDAIKFMSSWMGSTTGGKRRELQAPATQTVNCVDECVGGCPLFKKDANGEVVMGDWGPLPTDNDCYVCTAVVSATLNPNAYFGPAEQLGIGAPPNDNVITKKELAKTLDEFVCTVQKYSCPEATQNLAAKSARETNALFATSVAAANKLDCDYINWFGGGAEGATDRCVGMAMCMDGKFDGGVDIPRESQMGSMLCGLESIVDVMYGWFTSPDNKWKDASFYGVNTVLPLNGIAVPNDPDTNAQPEGIYTDGIVQTCNDQKWISGTDA